MKDKTFQSLIAAVAAITTLFFASSSLADSGGLPVQQFFPAPGGDQNYFSQHGALTLDSGGWSASAWFNFAQNILSVQQKATGRSTQIVEYNLQTNLQTAFGFGSGGQLTFDVPIVLYQAPGDRDMPVYKDIAQQAFGDIAIALKWRIYGEKGRGFKLALLGNLTIPTGKLIDMTGNGNVTFEFKLVPEYIINEKARVALNVGYLLRPDVRYLNLAVGNEFTFGAAVSWHPIRKRLELVGEIYGKTSADWTVSPTSASTPLELMLGAKYHIGGHAVCLGAGPGLTPGYGTPQYRVMLAYTYTMPDPPPPPAKPDVSPASPVVPAPAKETSGSAPAVERSAK